MGVHMPPSPMPYQASRRGGRSRPRPQAPDRHRRSCGRGATATPPATCGIGGAHIGMAMPCTSTPMSMCTRGTPPTPRRPGVKIRPLEAGSNAMPRTRRSPFRAVRTGAGPPARRSARGSPAARHASRSPRRPCRGSPARSGRSRGGPDRRRRRRRAPRPSSRGSSRRSVSFRVRTTATISTDRPCLWSACQRPRCAPPHERHRQLTGK